MQMFLVVIAQKNIFMTFQDMDSALHVLKNKKNYSSKIQIEGSQLANNSQVCCNSSPVKCNLITTRNSTAKLHFKD